MRQYSGEKADDLKDYVCSVLDSLGLSYRKEQYSAVKSAIIGKARRVDVVVVDSDGDALMHIECKHQRVGGTTEDKLFRAVTEANRDKDHGIPSIIVFSGFGFTPADMRHAMLNGSVRVELLEDWLQLYFNYEKEKPDSILEKGPPSPGPLFEA
ncbi:MAG: hypothetical protein KDD69_04125 [Bdellovibrionales bacterium]|nr:hypothetical protein [Bdellovibrionales bacterium]